MSRRNLRATSTAAVIGAGLSGLTAAYRLQQAGWSVQVFESDSSVGGRVRTVPHRGYLLDVGASALGASYSSYLGLTEELGIRHEVVPSSPYIGIYRHDRIHLMRLDQIVRSGLRTRLLSPRSKLKLARLAVDLGLAKARGLLDYSDMRKAAPIDTETARSYALRALNAEIDSYLCEPIVRTMLIADSDKVSKVELFSGVANIFTAQIFALLGGQGRLPTALADRLDVALDCPVQRVSDRGNHVEVEVCRDGGRPGTRSFDSCVITVPVPIAKEICPDRTSVLAPLDEGIGYTRGITVSVGTRVVPHSPAMLVQLPSVEDADIALMFLDHNKAPDRAPEGRGLIGCYWETDAAAKWYNQPDDDIIEHTISSMLRVFPELDGAIEMTHVKRWSHALPHTSIGAYRKIGEFNATLEATDRIQFAADYMSAAGQNTAVEFGDRAARNLITHQSNGRSG